MTTERQRELEADVARLKWQVALLVDYVRKQQAKEEEAKGFYTKAIDIVRQKRLAEPYTDDPTR